MKWIYTKGSFIVILLTKKYPQFHQLNLISIYLWIFWISYSIMFIRCLGFIKKVCLIRTIWPAHNNIIFKSLWKGVQLIDNSKNSKWKISVLIRENGAGVKWNGNSNSNTLLRCAVLFTSKYSLLAKNLQQYSLQVIFFFHTSIYPFVVVISSVWEYLCKYFYAYVA